MSVKIKDTVSASELAQWLHLSPSAIADNARQGFVVRAPTRGQYFLRESIRAYTSHIRETASGRTDDQTTKERVRLLRAQADSAEGKTKKLVGAYLDAAEAVLTWESIKRSGREVLMTIPARAKARVPHLTEHDMAVIREEVELALRPFDEHLEGAPGNA